MTQADPLHAMNIPGGAPTTILTEADIPFLRPIILAIKLNLISIQCDITAAFIHGHVHPTETIYVHQPRGFNHGNGDEVLRLKQKLYGLKQSPQYFFII
jgi:hypothetical protein